MGVRCTPKMLLIFSCSLLLCCFLFFKNYKKDAIHHNEIPMFVSSDTRNSNIVSPIQIVQNSSILSKGSTPIPLHKLRYDQHPPLSKDLIAHTAVFDPRPRDNHTNVTIIFANINLTIVTKGWVVGCGVDDKKASSFSLYSVFENTLMHWLTGEKSFKYENMEILCYDLPGKNGSEVYVIYKTASNSSEIKVISRSPLYIPAPRMTPSGNYNFTTLTCTKIHNRGVTFFHEFVRYQKTLGVDHVHANILDHFITDKGFQDLVVNDSFLWKQYKEGYLSFTVWKEWYAEGRWNRGDVYLHSEIIRKLDCVYRFLGTYDYAMVLDTDDFFVPRIPGKTNLKDYILRYCYSKPAGSCRFKWVWHYPKCGIDGEIIDGNVTKHLRTKIYNPNEAYNFKSVHSAKAILDASFHDARCKTCLKPGYKYVDIPTSIAYVAHNRYSPFRGRSPCANKGPLL